MDSKAGKLVAGVVAAVVGIALVGGIVFLLVARHTTSAASPVATSTPPEPNDSLAAEGGPGSALVLTNWDAPIGKGGTVAGVMEIEPQNQTVKAIQADYRKRHAGAPEKLAGAIDKAKFDAGPQILTFTVTVEKHDKYAVRFDSAHTKLQITGPNGHKIAVGKATS